MKTLIWKHYWFHGLLLTVALVGIFAILTHYGDGSWFLNFCLAVCAVKTAWDSIDGIKFARRTVKEFL